LKVSLWTEEENGRSSIYSIWSNFLVCSIWFWYKNRLLRTLRRWSLQSNPRARTILAYIPGQ